ncbi:MAG: NHL repeat-containing protein [Phycisphaerae bacterium]|nr:NHL repeat-containing protein [Phycisphaerae bacterium]
MKVMRNRIIRLIALLAIGAAASPVWAAPEDATADAVIGQSDFSTNGINQGGAGAGSLNGNRGLFVDSSGRLWVADSGNNRVLSWPSAAGFASGDNADIVLGQATFTDVDSNRGNNAPDATTLFDPRSVAVDADGRVYVADSGNKRVLRYDPPITNGMQAVQVFGQNGDFTKNDQANAMNANAFNMGNPDGIALDAQGNLYLADRFLHRVVVYLDPVNTDEQADTVLGQVDLTKAQRNQDDNNPVPGANTLNNPIGVGVDSDGNVYVADEGNNRVLRFEPPLTDNMNATRVYGQADFSGGNANDPDVSASSMNGPVYVAIDPVTGNLYVADAINNRILEFETPETNSVADRVLGQDGDFTTKLANKGGVSANSLQDVGGVATDADGNLYAGDRLNNRVLRYEIAESNDNGNNNNNNNNNNDNDNGNGNGNGNANNNANDNNDGPGAEAPLCGVCGDGAMMFAPMMFAGLAAVRRSTRRRCGRSSRSSHAAAR